jgi:hypothetical protein
VFKPLLLSSAALFVAASAHGQATKSYSLAGNEVGVYNLVGELSVKGGSGSAVVVEVMTVGPDAGRLSVETGELKGIATLRVQYPEDRIVYRTMGRGSNSQFTIRPDGTWGDFRGRWRDRAEGRRITIRGDGPGLEAAANLVITVPPGRKVGIHLGVGRLEASNIDGDLSLDAMSAEIIARETRGTLDIDTGSGDVSLESVAGQVSLDSGSGNITVTGLANGTLNIDTGSGAVLGSRLVAREVDIDTGSGDIRIDGVTSPRISLETGSGSVRADLAGPLEVVAVETGSGDVTVRLPQGVGATVDLETGSGDFTLDFPLELVRKSEGALRGRMGDGRGRIEIETGSGDISLIR